MADARTIDDINALTLRPKILVEVRIKYGDRYLLVDNGQITKCSIALRSVDTNRDNPELQASTIEVSILKFIEDLPVEQFWEAIKGKSVQIYYRSGYRGIIGTGSNREVVEDFSEWRTFYSTLDEDNFIDQDGIITIKGTDYVGQVAEQNPGQFITATYRASISGVTYRYMGYLINTYIYEILKPFMPNLTAPKTQKSWNKGTVYEKTPNFIGQAKSNILIEPKSRRKLLAQFQNFFPGTETADAKGDYNLNSKKFIFRDAGIPEAGWCDYALGGNSSTLNIKTWELSYGDVTEFKETQGPLIKQIKMANSDSYGLTGISDPDATTSGYKHIEDKAVEAGQSYIWDLSEPYYAVSVTGGGATLLNPYTVVFKSNITGIAKLDGIPITKTLGASTYAAAGTESVSIPINSEGQTTIEFEPFHGLRTFTYKDSDNAAQSDINCGMGDILAAQYDTNERQTWISFKWRGHPKMQPRDLLVFTDKDGTEWYCEIDNITLEHENGGLLSEITALKRYKK